MLHFCAILCASTPDATRLATKRSCGIDIGTHFNRARGRCEGARCRRRTSTHGESGPLRLILLPRSRSACRSNLGRPKRKTDIRRTAGSGTRSRPATVICRTTASGRWRRARTARSGSAPWAVWRGSRAARWTRCSPPSRACRTTASGRWRRARTARSGSAPCGGLARLAGGQVDQVLTTEQGLPDNSVRALAAGADGALWVGT